ncbi:MAG: HPr family phosphocarrier protein [Thermoguttaceae bacterium]|nr:HPr family phosphocarrier protein [Thermoguttaceae bacterium]
MLKKDLVVENSSGFHVRVASLVCKEAMKHAASIRLGKGGYEADCKSCLDLLTLMAPKGTKLTLSVDGADAQQAFDAIVSLFEHKFYEDEFAETA